MNIEQRIKRQIIINLVLLEGDEGIDLSTAAGIDSAYDDAQGYKGIFSAAEIIDEVEDFRCNGQTTDLPCEGSRHYESEQVALQLDDGTYISWTYWSGGGKHGEPESMDWMGKAYEVNCTEKEVPMTIYTFTVKEKLS